jgi:hypothetical protein
MRKAVIRAVELLAAILARLEIAYDLWVRETAGSG